MTSFHRIYSNDVEREALRQSAYSTTEHRLSLNRHRIRRAGQRQLTVIAMVAKQNGDSTIYNECRERLSLEPGQRLDTTFEVVESRRPSRERRHAFASNRKLATHVLEHDQAGFPLTQEQAMAAADLDHIV